MGLYIFIGVILVVIIGVVSLMLLGMRGRGRLVECPECGAQFKRPALATKSVGLGPGLMGMGDFTCPKCNHRANTSFFRYVDEKESKPGEK